MLTRHAHELPHFRFARGEGLLQQDVIACAQERQRGRHVLVVHRAIDRHIGESGLVCSLCRRCKAALRRQPVELGYHVATIGHGIGHAHNLELIRMKLCI